MPREEKRHKIEVHVAGVCFRENFEDIEILIVKRQKIVNFIPRNGSVEAGRFILEKILRKR